MSVSIKPNNHNKNNRERGAEEKRVLKTDALLAKSKEGGMKHNKEKIFLKSKEGCV